MKRLETIERNNPFRVPKGYFDEVNHKIISSTSENEKQASRISFIRQIRPYLLAAASVTGIMLISYTAIRLLNGERLQNKTHEVISEETLSPYLYDLDLYSLEENAEPYIQLEKIPDVSKSEIVDYLLLNNIEITDIYEQL